MTFSAKDIKDLKAKRAKKNNSPVYYKTSKINGNLLKGIGIILVLSPFIYFLGRAIITFLIVAK